MKSIIDKNIEKAIEKNIKNKLTRLNEAINNIGTNMSILHAIVANSLMRIYSDVRFL
jgi:hypothetical protein